MRKLQENPDDTEAMNQMETAQELLANWTGGDCRKCHRCFRSFKTYSVGPTQKVDCKNLMPLVSYFNRQSIPVLNPFLTAIIPVAEDNKIMPMSWAELNSGNPAWAKKEQFHVARKVEGLGKKLLEKMGWKVRERSTH